VEAEGEAAARLVGAGMVGLPRGPGVYSFRDGAGGLLYVGVSRGLDRRVRSYFAPRHPPASKAARIARLAARVELRTAASHLEALVLEARTIRTERPYFNRRLKESGRHAYVRVDVHDPFPRLAVTRRLDEGRSRYLGPFPGGRRLTEAVTRVADALGLRTCPGALRPDPAGRACLRLDLSQCLAPCVACATPGAYGRQVVRALLTPAPAAAAPRRTPANRAPCPPPVGGGPGHAALPAAAGGRARGGGAAGAEHRLLAARAARAAASAPDRAALGPAFATVAAALRMPVPALLPPDALDEVRIVTAWLTSPEGRAATVDYGRVGHAAAWASVAARTTPGPLWLSSPAG
jgi:hypothetical protein